MTFNATFIASRGPCGALTPMQSCLHVFITDMHCITLGVTLVVYVVAPTRSNVELACGGRWKGTVIVDRVVLALQSQFPDLNLQRQPPGFACTELCLQGTSLCSCACCLCDDIYLWHSPSRRRNVEAEGSVCGDAAEAGACNCLGRCVLPLIFS